jgi:hypothetical protein
MESTMNDFLKFNVDVINQGFVDFIHVFGPIAVALATVGVLTKAMIDFAKDVIPGRLWWQQRWIGTWIERKGGSRQTVKALEQLAAAGDGRALYAQTSEKMVGLINAALQMALDNPRANKLLIVAFAGGATQQDLDLVLAGREEIKEREYLARYVEARNRVASHIQRSLDGILVAMSDQWSRRLQVASIIVSSVFIYGAAASHGSIRSGGDVVLWFMVAFGGGLLAPGINDFAKTLTSLGKRT